MVDWPEWLKKTMTKILKIASAKDIAEGIRGVVVNMIAISEAYVSALAMNPKIKADLEEMGISRRLLARMEMVGAGKIDHRLALETHAAARSVMLLPMSDQVNVLDHGVEVMDTDTEVRRIPVDQLSPKQVSQVFANGEVRTLAQQRTYLQEHDLRQVVEEQPNCKVGKDSVSIRHGGKFSRAVIAGWLAQMV